MAGFVSTARKKNLRSIYTVVQILSTGILQSNCRISNTLTVKSPEMLHSVAFCTLTFPTAVSPLMHLCANSPAFWLQKFLQKAAAMGSLYF